MKSDLKGFEWKLTIPSGYLTVRHGKWPIEIDGLPIENGGSFHGELLNLNNQMVM